MAKSFSYKDNYVAVNEHSGSVLVPVINNLVLVNEIRAFRIQQYDYKDRFTVFSSVHATLDTNDLINQEVSGFLNEYQELKTYYDKIKLLCEYGLSEQSIKIVLDQLGGDEIASHYIALGPERLKKLYYNKTNIKRELGIVVFSKELLVNTILSRFTIGDKIPNSDIKDILGNLYESINYTATPKAIDLEEYFGVKKCKVTISEKGRVNALEIVGIKPEYSTVYNNLKIINNNIL